MQDVMKTFDSWFSPSGLGSTSFPTSQWKRVETTIKVFPDDGEKIIGNVVSALSKEAGRMAEVKQITDGVYHLTMILPADDPLLKRM